ncbi:MAG: 50S ribosomal protein L23 [Nitrososphaerota archaeon]
MSEASAFKVIIRPHVSEKAFSLIQNQNTLTFIAHREANKASIKQAVEALYGVKVKRVRVAITPQGKKAYVTLSEGFSASDVASKIGIL